MVLKFDGTLEVEINFKNQWVLMAKFNLCGMDIKYMRLALIRSILNNTIPNMSTIKICLDFFDSSF